MVNLIKYPVLFLCLLAGSLVLSSQNKKQEKTPEPTTRILFVFDASQSMYGRWQSDMKMLIAQRILSNLLDSLQNTPNLELALRVYGHQKPYPPQNCDDTNLEVPFASNNISRIKHKLNSLNPKGTTPIAFALEQARFDFTPCENCRNIIILITDGIEECGGDACKASELLQKEGISLKPFVIGIGSDFSEALNCVGTYFDAQSEAAFNKALNVVITQALNATTAQVNLLDEEGKPSETNVNMTFYDNVSGKVKYNFVHTLNNKGLPDTLSLDPLLNYDIVVHTIPEIRKNDVALSSGKHNIIAVDAPQGSLKLAITGNSRAIRNLQAIIRQHDHKETLHIQNFGEKENYLTGNYDLEVLCLPRINLENINIGQSKTTTIEIPLPGVAVIRHSVDGYGSLYQDENNELKLIYRMFESKEKVENLVLQPGKYRAVFRSKFVDKAAYTVEKSFEIESGKTIEIKLY